MKNLRSVKEYNNCHPEFGLSQVSKDCEEINCIFNTSIRSAFADLLSVTVK